MPSKNKCFGMGVKMKFKFNGDTYQVHPLVVKVMWVLFVSVGLYASHTSGFLPLVIGILATLLMIAFVFRDGNIQ